MDTFTPLLRSYLNDDRVLFKLLVKVTKKLVRTIQSYNERLICHPLLDLFYKGARPLGSAGRCKYCSYDRCTRPSTASSLVNMAKATSARDIPNVKLALQKASPEGSAARPKTSWYIAARKA